MEVMEQFVQKTSQELGEDETATRAAAAGLLESLRQQVEERNFAQLIGALPGAEALLHTEAAEAVEDNQNGLAGAFGWIRGWAGGTDRDAAFLAALEEAGFSEDRIGQFVNAFKRFAANYAGWEAVQRVFAEAPDLEIIARKGHA